MLCAGGIQILNGSGSDWLSPTPLTSVRYSSHTFQQDYSYLTSTHSCLLQPLPEKHTLFEQMDRYDRDFIDSRMQLLNRFLNRVADHPVLGRDRTYKNLLTQSQAVCKTRTGPSTETSILILVYFIPGLCPPQETHIRSRAVDPHERVASEHRSFLYRQGSCP